MPGLGSRQIWQGSSPHKMVLPLSDITPTVVLWSDIERGMDGRAEELASRTDTRRWKERRRPPVQGQAVRGARWYL